ncbi:hypothetical protein C8J57DRAFT_1502500 [Mycena rebaudengoi]|nr:hypothetical protein C8J57DRAFT_1502500 [Mycena rebaudengoi]
MPPAVPSPDALTPRQIAALINPANHPTPLTTEELENLTGQLTADELEEVVDHIGLSPLARQLPPFLLKILLVAQRITERTPSSEDDEIQAFIRNFDALHFSAANDLDPDGPTSLPPAYSSASSSSVASVATPLPPSTPVKTKKAHAAPSTPTQSSGYIIQSPSKSGIFGSWFEAGALTSGVAGASAQNAVTSSPSCPRKKASKGYVIFYGGKVAVFTHWPQVQPWIIGYGPAIHCGFPSLPTAEAALEYARVKGWTSNTATTPDALRKDQPFSAYEENTLNSPFPNRPWYAVCRGVEPGIYKSYIECSLNVTGVPSSLFKSFTTREAAEQALSEAVERDWVQHISRPVPLGSQ